MKIEKVSFDNINSLGGHFEVDLLHSSLTDAGIFVITGPTGVGKTTLLDAICYAIYGCTARQPRLSASSNEIMTHGARFCRAEAWVEKDGQRYLFTCEQRRKKVRVEGADPYTTPQRSVSRVGADGVATLLANKVREVEAEAERLMKFSNFTRCMMLAQGEFARFLKDSAAGRSEALATITGTEIYQRIGEKVQEHVAALRAQIQQVALYEVLSPEDRLRLEESQRAAEAALEAGKAALADIDSKLAWLADVAKAAAARAACETALRRAREAADAFVQAGQAARIAAAQQSLLLRPLEQAADGAALAVQQAARQLAQEQAWLAAHPGSEEKAAAEGAAATLAAQEPVLLARLRFIADEVQPREERIGQAAALAAAAAGDAATRLRESGKAQQAVEKAEKNAETARLGQAAAEAVRRQLLPDAALAENLPAIRQRLDDWAACPPSGESLPDAADIAARAAAWQQELDGILAGRRRDELPQQLARLDRLQAAHTRHATAQARLATAVEDAGAAQAALAAVPPVAQAQEALDAAQQREQLAYKIQDAGQKLEELYREFCAGKLSCCPCCGSPVPHGHPVQAASALAEAKAQVALAQKELRRCQKIQEDARAAHAAAQAALGAAQQAAGQAAQELADALAALGWESAPSDLDEQADALRRHIAALAGLDSRRAVLDLLEKQDACRRALHTALASSTAGQPATLDAARELVVALDARRTAWQKADARATQAAQAHALAQERLGSAQATAADKQARLEHANTSATQAAEAEEQLRSELAQLWQGGPAREAAEAAHRQLDSLRNTAATTRDAWQALLREQAMHRALAQAAETQLPALRTEQEQADRRLAEGLGERGFADRAACAAARLEESQLNTLLEQQSALVQALAQAEGACRQAAAHESTLRARALTEENEETLARARAAQATVCHQQQELATELLARRQADDNCRLANAEKEAQTAGTCAELDRWKRLYEILGNTRDGFKKYAQRITFNLLLRQANAQLRRLSDRYTLMQDPVEELGLLVLDRYQDNAQGRACSNLSGGESFIVSLALALGLSRMAGETRIDTLFLDEGFGTLDADALENVLDCLQGLRAGGKLIGIISHVEALKERIPANIELVPLGASGRSTMVAHEAVVARPGV